MSRSRKPDRVRPLERALLRAGDAERRLRQAAAGGLGLGLTDLDALLLLDESGALPAGRIAEALAITTGAVTGLVDRLERAGWVERARHPTDRRQVMVELAKEQRAKIDAHRAMRERLLADALSDVEDATLSACAALLEAAAEGLLKGAIEASQAEVEPVSSSEDGMRAPIGSAKRGRLRFMSGVPRLELRGARIKDLYRAEPEGKMPLVRVDRGTVTFHYKGFGWFGARDTRLALTLTSTIPWTIEIRGGVSDLSADLHDIELEALDITGGASSSAIRLPRPRGDRVVRVKGGANHIVVRRPRGSYAQAIVRGGANSLAFDEQRLGSIGGTVRLATPGFDDAEDRWTIELTGGASDLSVIEE